jgi:hypothetical protein
MSATLDAGTTSNTVSPQSSMMGFSPPQAAYYQVVDQLPNVASPNSATQDLNVVRRVHIILSNDLPRRLLIETVPESGNRARIFMEAAQFSNRSQNTGGSAHAQTSVPMQTPIYELAVGAVSALLGQSWPEIDSLWEELYRKIDKWLEEQVEPDDEVAIPRQDVIRAVRRFIADGQRYHAPPPGKALPDADGCVTLYWDCGDRSAAIFFEGSDKAVAFAQRKSASVYRFEDSYVSGSDLSEFFSELREHFPSS